MLQSSHNESQKFKSRVFNNNMLVEKNGCRKWAEFVSSPERSPPCTGSLSPDEHRTEPTNQSCAALSAPGNAENYLDRCDTTAFCLPSALSKNCKTTRCFLFRRTSNTHVEHTCSGVLWLRRLWDGVESFRGGTCRIVLEKNCWRFPLSWAIVRRQKILLVAIEQTSWPK